MAKREVMLVGFLDLATRVATDEPAPTWDRIVTLACQIGSSYSVTRAEYEVLRSTTVGQVFAPELNSDG